MPSLSVDGQAVYYASRRQGHESLPPVVLIHGAGGTHQHWLYQVRDLPVTAYAVDLPGHGHSQGEGRDTIAGYGDWLIRWMDVAGLQRVVLAGHSMGGAIALDVALRYPDRIAGLGLVSTGARLRVAPAILDGLCDEPEHTVGLVCDWSFSRQAPPELVETARRQMADVPAAVLHGDFSACDAFDVRAQLDRIQAPALVVCGTADRMTPVRYAMSLRDGLPAARLHVVHAAGHMIMIERPEAVTRALRQLVGGA